MIRRPPRSTQSRSSAASDVYKRQGLTYQRDDIAKIAVLLNDKLGASLFDEPMLKAALQRDPANRGLIALSLIHISEPTRPY